MASEEKKPKRKYGQNWAKLSNSQADVSAVYEKLVGTLPSLQQNEKGNNDQKVIDADLFYSPKDKKDQEKDVSIDYSTTEDNLTLGTLTLGSKLPQGQNVPGDILSPVSQNTTLPINKENLFAKNNAEQIAATTYTSNNLVSKTSISTEDNMSLGSISPWVEIDSHYLKLPNFIIDNLMKTLDSSEFTVYLRLYRLSHGFKQTTCLVGHTALSEACNLSSRQIRRIIPNLVSRNLIKVIQVYNEAQKQGTLYEVSTLDKMSLVSKDISGQNVPSAKMSYNKIDDDPLKEKNHHQTEHEKEVMMIYQNITENSWTKADVATYQKIKQIPLQAIETAIRLATQRASNRPNSLAYFIKEILSVASPQKQNRSKQKKAIEKIVDRIRNSFIGASYSPSDFVYKVKEACLREDIAFDNDLLDEIMNKKNS